MRHAAVPTYMLETCKELSVPYVTEQFCVEPHLAEHRINEYVHNKRFRNMPFQNGIRGDYTL